MNHPFLVESSFPTCYLAEFMLVGGGSYSSSYEGNASPYIYSNCPNTISHLIPSISPLSLHYIPILVDQIPMKFSTNSDDSCTGHFSAKVDWNWAASLAAPSWWRRFFIQPPMRGCCTCSQVPCQVAV